MADEVEWEEDQKRKRLEELREKLATEISFKGRAALEAEERNIIRDLKAIEERDSKRLEEEKAAEEQRRREEEQRAAREHELEVERTRQQAESERQQKQFEREDVAKQKAEEERERALERLSDPEFIKKKRFAEKHNLEIEEGELDKLSKEELKEIRHQQEGGWKGRAGKRLKESEVGAGFKAAREESKARRIDAYRRIGHAFWRFLIISIIVLIVGAIFIFLILPRFVGWNIVTQMSGTGVEASVGITNIERDIKGMTNPYLQALKITPTEAFNAQEVNSEMIVNEDAGVYIQSLYMPSPARADQNIIVKGKIAAVSTFEEDRGVVLTVHAIKEGTSEKLDDVENWTCKVGNQKNVFVVKDSPSADFICTHPPLTEEDLQYTLVVGEEGTMAEKKFKVTFEIVHKNSARVSRDLFVTKLSAYRGLDDGKIESFGINRELAKSFSATDKKTIQLSAGLSGEEDTDSWFTRVFNDVDSENVGLMHSFIPALEERTDEMYDQYLGIAFSLIGEGEKLTVTKLELDISSDKSISPIIKQSQFEKTGEPFEYKGRMLQRYTLSSDYAGTVLSTDLSGTARNAYYLAFYVTEDYLGGRDYRSFPVLANIEYDYVARKTILIEIEEKPKPVIT